jgi:hypothetical protein
MLVAVAAHQFAEPSSSHRILLELSHIRCGHSTAGSICLYVHNDESILYHSFIFLNCQYTSAGCSMGQASKVLEGNEPIPNLVAILPVLYSHG